MTEMESMGNMENCIQAIAQLLSPELDECLEEWIMEKQLSLKEEVEETVDEGLEEEIFHGIIGETDDEDVLNYKEEECCVPEWGEEDVEYLEGEEECEEEDLKGVDYEEENVQYDVEYGGEFSEIEDPYVEGLGENHEDYLEYEEEPIMEDGECDEKQVEEEAYEEGASNDEEEYEENLEYEENDPEKPPEVVECNLRDPEKGEEECEDDSVEGEENYIKLPGVKGGVQYEEEIPEMEGDSDVEEALVGSAVDDETEYDEEPAIDEEEAVEMVDYRDFNVEIQPEVADYYFEEPQEGEEYEEGIVDGDEKYIEELVAEEKRDRNGKFLNDYDYELELSEVEGSQDEEQVDEEEYAVDIVEGELEYAEELSAMQEEIDEYNAESVNFEDGYVEVPPDLEIYSFIERDEGEQIYVDGYYADEEDEAPFAEEARYSCACDKDMSEMEGGNDEGVIEEEYVEGTEKFATEEEEAMEGVDYEDDNVEVSPKIAIRYLGESDEEEEESKERNAYGDIEYVKEPIVEEEHDHVKIIQHDCDYENEDQAEEEAYDGEQVEEEYDDGIIYGEKQYFDEDDVKKVSYEDSRAEFYEGEVECVEGTVEHGGEGVECEKYDCKKDRNEEKNVKEADDCKEEMIKSGENCDDCTVDLPEMKEGYIEGPMGEVQKECSKEEFIEGEGVQAKIETNQGNVPTGNRREELAGKAEKTAEEETGDKLCRTWVKAGEQEEEEEVDQSVGEQAVKPIFQKPVPSKRCLLMMAKIIYPELAESFDSRLGSVEA